MLLKNNLLLLKFITINKPLNKIKINSDMYVNVLYLIAHLQTGYFQTHSYGEQMYDGGSFKTAGSLKNQLIDIWERIYFKRKVRFFHYDYHLPTNSNTFGNKKYRNVVLRK